MSHSPKTFFAVALALVAVACGPTVTTEEVDDDSNADSDTKLPSKNGADSGASTPSTPGTGTPSTPDGGTPTDPGTDPTTTDCSSSATYDACFSCCDAPSGGQLAAADEAFGSCACESGGACKNVCGNNFCTGDAPSAACETCLTNTCEPQADALCTSSQCQAAVQCLQTSGCDAKE